MLARTVSHSSIPTEQIGQEARSLSQRGGGGGGGGGGEALSASHSSVNGSTRRPPERPARFRGLQVLTEPLNASGSEDATRAEVDDAPVVVSHGTSVTQT